VTGTQKKLELRSDLIGFQFLPGRHDGKHLAQCLFFVFERLKITEKVWSFFGLLLKSLNHDRLDGSLVTMPAIMTL
jgi:hypothetical protein